MRPKKWKSIPNDAVICISDPRCEGLVRVLKQDDTAHPIEPYDTEVFHPEDDEKAWPLEAYYR